MTQVFRVNPLTKVYGMREPPSAKRLVQADKLESSADDPNSHDDPKWLKRHASAIRRAAERRQRSHVRKSESRRKARRKNQH